MGRIPRSLSARVIAFERHRTSALDDAYQRYDIGGELVRRGNEGSSP